MNNARSTLSPETWSLIGMAIVTVAIVLRLYQLELRPLHHDEGVNAWFIMQLVRPPHDYRYDPANYHGPTLYYLTLPAVKGIGMTTFALRLIPALCGTIVLLLALGLRSRMGAVGAIVAAGLLAVSPGAVYHSRYYIHEMLLVCCTFASVAGMWTYLERRQMRFLLVVALTQGLAFATKETAIISAAVLMLAAVATATWIRTVRAVRADPRLAMETDVGLRGATGTVEERVERKDIPSRWRPTVSWRTLATVGLCVAVFLLVNVVFYTSFFSHWSGITDALRSLAMWGRTGTRDHVHPWHAYLIWLARGDAPILLAGLAGCLLLLWLADDAAGLFTAFWAVGTLAAYSLIPYKTPWLALNMLVPLAIAAGFGSDRAWQSWSAGRRRMLLNLVGLVLLVWSAYQCLTLNFIHYDDDRYAYPYATTRRQTLELVDRVHEIASRTAKPATIAVLSPDYFPLPWYLRDLPAGFYARVPADTNDTILIGSRQQSDQVEARFGDRYVAVGEYSLRPGVQLVLYVRRDLQLN